MDADGLVARRAYTGAMSKRTIITIAALFLLGVNSTTADDLTAGDPAPDFELQASDGEAYRLSDFAGEQAVVIAWFPKAYTSGCTIECKSLAENGDLIREYDVTYFMASVDPLEDNIGFAEEQNADFPLLSDPDKAVAEAYGVLSPAGYANRWTFYIGMDGTILHVDKEVNPATSAEDMAANLGELGVERR